MTTPRAKSGDQQESGGVEPVAAALRALEALAYAGLHTEWRRLYRAAPPKRLSRDLLRLGIGWKIQEQAYGGLSAATKRRLSELARTLERDGDIRRNRIAQLKPGARLLRDWGGETHKVTVLHEGFEYHGRSWRSLSAIARAITGMHWSGPRFFGLRDPNRDSAEPR
jgi:hypothetical protein